MEETKQPFENPTDRHEHRDVDVRRLALMGVALVACVVLSLLGMSWLFKYYAGQPVTPAPPLMAGPQIPPKPRLEANPHADLVKKLNADEAVLNGYGWVDRSTQTVRIPIDRAMDLLAQRGLPVREQEGAAHAARAAQPVQERR